MTTPTLTHEWLRMVAEGPYNDPIFVLTRIARAAIAVDEMNHNPRNAQEAALRDLLQELGLRK